MSLEWIDTGSKSAIIQIGPVRCKIYESVMGDEQNLSLEIWPQNLNVYSLGDKTLSDSKAKTEEYLRKLCEVILDRLDAP